MTYSYIDYSCSRFTKIHYPLDGDKGTIMVYGGHPQTERVAESIVEMMNVEEADRIRAARNS